MDNEKLEEINYAILEEMKELNKNLIKFLDFYASEHGWLKHE